MTDVLLFGGSFDPPHRGHVELPKQARELLGAAAVWYMPAGRPPHKLGQAQTPGHHRLAMLRLALADQPWATVLTDELDRAADGQPSYTIDTLRALEPRVPAGARLRLLIGSDQVAIFESWKDWQEIIQRAEPIVFPRAPAPGPDQGTSRLGDLPPPWRARLLALPELAVSSTDLRHRLATGQSTGDHLHPAVLTYIQNQHLYRPAFENLIRSQ